MVILSNRFAPAEGVRHAEPNTTVYFENVKLGKGTMYIAENIFCWISSTGEGFSLEYQSIYIHGVSKDLTNFPEECLYMMVDGKINVEDASEAQELSRLLNSLSVGEDSDSDDDDDKTCEMHFVPDNKNMLDVMFSALSDCQALNPDPNYRSDEDDGVVIAPPFRIDEGNGAIPEEGIDDDNIEEVMDADQFEDAE